MAVVAPARLAGGGVHDLEGGLGGHGETPNDGSDPLSIEPAAAFVRRMMLREVRTAVAKMTNP
jgi:hypothetical protein